MKTKEITLKLKFNRHQAAALLAVFFLAWHPAFLGSETLTLTTYYPAPYGGYVSLLTTQQTLLARDSGNVGIRTGAVLPRRPLDVGGEIVATNRITMAQDMGTASRTWHLDNSAGTFRIFDQPNISTVGTERFTINSLGNANHGGNLNMSRNGAAITGTNMSISGLCYWRAMSGSGWSYCAAGENLVSTNFSTWTSEWTCIGRGLANSPTATMCAQGVKTTGVSGSMLCCRIQ
ncbi:MAG: hypothetical protein A2X29_10340 [Elusimicrobia bacterium GWA2_64_40]|nr:MAG: hypothetical protein A2X29_10340 [Elusimicrobia bacterium GWA2_64_40]